MGNDKQNMSTNHEREMHDLVILKTFHLIKTKYFHYT